MTRRIIEIIVGSIIALSLITNYSDKEHGSRLFIWYVLTPDVLKGIVWLTLFSIAGRLLFSKFKDHSNYIYSILVKIFGDPKKPNKSN